MKSLRLTNLIINTVIVSGLVVLSGISCSKKSEDVISEVQKSKNSSSVEGILIRAPFISGLYSADPSAHIFKGKLYIYPSHDLDNNTPPDNEGNHYDMEDYHLYVYNDKEEKVEDLGMILHLNDVPWAAKQMWAPDVAEHGGHYYFYFPAKDKEGIFRIGVAIAESPEGPFIPQETPIEGVFSMDPCAFVDDDGQTYLYFGGLWGGQLERWSKGSYDPSGKEPLSAESALGPRVVLLKENMTEKAGEVIEIGILNKEGNPILSGDHHKRFFEGSWIHKYNETYYLSYSTGDTHKIVYATADNPLGPFTFRGVILNPVTGWTTHHSIAEYKGQWYLFYHNAALSGVDHKRNVQVTPLTYNSDGTINTITPTE